MQKPIKRFTEEEEAALIMLLEHGHAVTIFSAEELGTINRKSFMEHMFTAGFSAIDEVQQGVRCPDCLGQHEGEAEVH